MCVQTKFANQSEAWSIVFNKTLDGTIASQLEFPQMVLCSSLYCWDLILIAQPSKASNSMGQLELWLALYLVGIYLAVCGDTL
jgi:hypothetical protein